MSKKNWAILILVILHLVGIFGMTSSYQSIFLALTPLNLLVSLLVLIYFHKTKSRRFFLVMVCIMLAGFLIEIIGVNTGWPFGNYWYGDPLGPKLLGTPFMIGVNWFLLTYCGAMIFRKVTKSPLVNAFLAGVSITAFDVILEPVAIQLNFWNWEANSVPLQNYITWLVCITLFSYFLYKMEKQAENPIAKWVLGAQILFFGGILIVSQL